MCDNALWNIHKLVGDGGDGGGGGAMAHLIAETCLAQ